MRSLARTLGWRFAPGVMADRAHRHELHLADHFGLTELNDRFVGAHGDRVRHGPFTGLRLPPPRVALIQRLLGTYELELVPWIEAALRAGHDRFVDIGAADGYYAVGLAMRGLRVDGFELSRTARRRCADLAAANDVSVTLHGRADGATLARLAPGRALVLCDCEGAEAEILNNEAVAALRQATVIVEMHDDQRPGVSDLLRGRFAATHDDETRVPVARDPTSYPELAILPEADRHRAIVEMRADVTPWVRFTPREPRPTESRP